MASGDTLMRGPTSPAHDCFELMFQGADLLSSFWQPLLKSVGRWQLEVAQLGARQARAAIALGHRLGAAGSADAISEAYRTYWNELHACYEDAGRNMAAAVVRASPQNVILDMPQQRKRAHDRLELLTDLEDRRLERKVA